MQRRDFLKQGVFYGAAWASSSLQASAAQDTALSRKGTPKKVLVLGAGLAGLAAAYELDRAGHDVTVLEARMRPGGRVHTIREPFSDGLYAEAGAAFVPVAHPTTMHYVRLFDLPLDPMPEHLRSDYFVRGRLLTGSAEQWPLELTPDERQAGPMRSLIRYVGPLLREIGDPEAPDWPQADLERFDRVSFADLLRRQGASEDLVAVIRCTFYDLYGDGLETLSALFMLRELALTLKGRDPRSFTIRGGTDLFPRAFAARLREKIRYGAPVTRIEQDARGVRATFIQGGERQTLAADRMICTLPFSTLRRVAVEPAFSRGKMRAIRELPYTAVVRTFLQTRRRFWTPEQDGGMVGTDLLIRWTRVVTFNQPGPRGILESYAAGPSARRYSRMGERERIAAVVPDMERVYPGVREHLEGGTSYDWEKDQWARGDYAWFRPGQMTALTADIASIEGRVHFAGEHTSPYPGWMQGALMSGVRAAQEVNDR